MQLLTIRKILFAVLAGIVAFVIFDIFRDDASSNIASQTSMTLSGKNESAVPARGEKAEQSMGQFVFRKRTPIGEPQGPLFDSHVWQPLPLSSATEAAPPPAAPPMPYKYSGAFVYDGQLKIFLAKGDTIIPVGLGETIDGGYRIESIDEQQITLTYLPLEQKQIIPISTSLSFTGARMPAAAERASSRAAADLGHAVGDSLVLVLDDRQRNKPAQLLWQGPPQVKLGTQFSVALRVTSAQPVSASPMQIKVNSALFETVSVKPGRFFKDRERSFNYRIDPGGSIFVGASNPKPALATDAEFVVLTLKPLKPAPAAELAIASLSLHGPAGQVIPFDMPATFSTAITH